MNYGLAPRPQLDPDEMAALLVAAQELLRTQALVVSDPLPSWRFSGRWFNAGPYALRRPYRVVNLTFDQVEQVAHNRAQREVLRGVDARDAE